MKMFWNKPKITFDCQIPGVERVMPMIPARELKHEWVQKAQRELSEMRKSPTWGMEKVIHTAKCPGIFTLQRHGWVMRTWQDITIETNGDGWSFSWTTPLDQQALNPSIGHYVQSHSPAQLADYMDNWPKDALRSLVKIQAPWTCSVPKGYYLLEMGVPYLDENRFSTVQGFFSSDTGYAQMSPQLIWRVPKGRVLIKAGTPVAQYMLIPKDKIDMDINVVGTCSEQQFFSLATGNRFISNYGAIKTIFRNQQ